MAGEKQIQASKELTWITF